MDIQIIDTPLTLNLYGYQGMVTNGDYAGSAFKQMDKMWQTIRNEHLRYKGMNIWVYETGHKIFTGVELETLPTEVTSLENKTITIPRYAYYKHIGPYNRIKNAGTAMTSELESRKLKTIHPYIEIYGHWQNDESKLETELIMALV